MLFKEIHTFKIQMENQQGFIEKINEFITNYKDVDIDLREEMELKENKLKELKMTRHKLKEDNIRQTADLQAALKLGQEEVEALEQTNKKLEEDIETLISEKTTMNSEMEQIATEKEEQSGYLLELIRKNNNLKHQVKQAKSDKLKNKKKRTSFGAGASQASNSSFGDKRLANWGSDSSLEGADTGLYNLIRERTKSRGLEKGSSHKS